MNPKLQTTTHKKARAFSTGFEMISRFDAATRQGLADDNTLLNLYNLCEQSCSQGKLLHLDGNITITTGFDTGKTVPNSWHDRASIEQ